MPTTTYTTTIDFDYRAKRDNGRRNKIMEEVTTEDNGRSTEEKEQHKIRKVETIIYCCDVIALENKEPKKKKGTLWKYRPRGGRFGKSSESRDITSI